MYQFQGCQKKVTTTHDLKDERYMTVLCSGWTVLCNSFLALSLRANGADSCRREASWIHMCLTIKRGNLWSYYTQWLRVTFQWFLDRSFCIWAACRPWIYSANRLASLERRTTGSRAPPRSIKSGRPSGAKWAVKKKVENSSFIVPTCSSNARSPGSFLFCPSTLGCVNNLSRWVRHNIGQLYDQNSEGSGGPECQSWRHLRLAHGQDPLGAPYSLRLEMCFGVP